MNNKQKKAMWWMLVISILLISIVLFFLFKDEFKDGKNGNKESKKETLSQADINSIYHNGEEYVYNARIKNILFLGIDNNEEISINDILGQSGQADSIMILSMDMEHNTTRILQVSRNTMTEIDLYDNNGNLYATETAQIATQYAYGNGANTSCWATKRTVSELLKDLPIHGYFALDISGVSIVNDLLGGVTITIPEDYTEIDPAFEKGKTITLNGKQAEKYIRYRDKYLIGGNDLRMQRQAQYIPALFNSLQKISDESDEKLEKKFESVMDYMVTDLTAEELVELLRMDWEMEDIVSVPGESVKGEKYEEFYVNEEELENLLIKLFYKLK